MSGAWTQRLVRKRIGLARIGWHTFLAHGIGTGGECDCGVPGCKAAGKHPRTSGPDRGATSDIERIMRETRSATANIGVHCGLSNLVVLDIDPRNGGRETFAKLQRQHRSLESAVIAETGGGGEHHFFRESPGIKYPATFGPGVDVLSGNKYPIIPPSRHRSGSHYRWRADCDPISFGFILTPLPSSVLDLWRDADSPTPIPEPTEESEEEVARLQSALACISADCSRNEWRDHLFSIHATGWACAEEVARNWSLTVPHRWGDEAFEKIWRSASASRPGGRTVGSVYHVAKQNGWIDPTAPARADTKGDISNGRRFAARHRDALIYDRAAKVWREYNAGIWRACATGQQVAAAKAIADDILSEAATSLAANPTDANRATHSQALRVHRTQQRVSAMIDMAAAEPGMSVADSSAFDANPYLLGVTGGVIDLKSGTWLPPSPAYRISKCAGVLFDPDARCPHFKAFLTDILGNEEEVSFVQRFSGYTLTGCVEEEAFLFMQGAGANGKSVLANVLAGVLGDYSETVGSELLAITKNDSEANRYKARLRGLRMALVNEVGQNDSFNDQRVKEIVSREAIPARQLYGEAFSFPPSHKLWIRGNHRPAVLDSGDGMWRRLILLPFLRQFEATERVRDLDATLLREEGSGILNWMIVGCLQWLKHGLAIPKSIQRETAQYRNDTDIVGEWIDTECDARPGLRGKIIGLYESYRRFCFNAGMTPRPRVSFVRLLSARGFQRKASNGVAYLCGIDVGVDDL